MCQRPLTDSLEQRGYRKGKCQYEKVLCITDHQGNTLKQDTTMYCKNEWNLTTNTAMDMEQQEFSYTTN